MFEDELLWCKFKFLKLSVIYNWNCNFTKKIQIIIDCTCLEEYKSFRNRRKIAQIL